LGSAAARPGAGREHGGVGALHHLGEVVVRLQVADDRLAAGRLDVRGVVGVADQRPGPMARPRQQALEAERDLAVTSGDDDVHTVTVRQRVARFRRAAR
jgi:hypothetical protein